MRQGTIKHLLIPPIRMYSSITESTENPQMTPLSDGQDLYSDPSPKQELLADLTGGSIPGASIGHDQGWRRPPALDRSDEASGPWPFHHASAKIEELPVFIQLEPQFSLPSCEVSAARFPDPSAY
jgi:hypothetical protein